MKESGFVGKTSAQKDGFTFLASRNRPGL